MHKTGNAGRTIARWGLVSTCCVLCLVLLVAEKTAAGASFGGIALLLALPRTWTRGRRVLLWIRVLLIVVFLAVAVESIAGTDLQPCQEKAGVAAVDKASAIIDVFRGKLFGTAGACGPTRGGPRR